MTWFRRTLTGKEGASHEYTGWLDDGKGVAIGAANILTLAVTLYDQRTEEILNERNEQPCLNENGVTVADATNPATGLPGTQLTWNLLPADMPIVNDQLANEGHIARFDFTYGVDGRAGHHEVKILVRNLELSVGVE